MSAEQQQSNLPLSNEHNVYILGAGFSVEGGLPLVGNFLNRMRDSHPWLISQGRTKEAEAVQLVLEFRLKATSASYWTQICEGIGQWLRRNTGEV
jgi:hypothetical protein